MSVTFDPGKSIFMSAPFDEAAEGSITVHNNTSHDIKIKVKVTEAQLFVAKPNIALVNSGCVQIVIVRYRPPGIDFPQKPKCQIQYIELNKVVDGENVFEQNRDKIQQRNFRLVFPVPETTYSNVDKEA